MKKIITLVALLFLVNNVFSQAPQKMSYQAVIRNASNVLVSNTTVGMRISILQGSVFGSAVYAETQTKTTNANGLVSLEIGNGTVINGIFANINWGVGPYFIKTETDPSGGVNYSITGTTELMSVPYALFAANSTAGPTGPQGAQGIQGPIGPQGTFQNGVNPGDMYYWDGSTWVLIPIGTHGQNLTVCNGVPTWGPCPILVPTLTTNAITSITSSTAIGGGNISNDGGALVTARGVCYGTSINPTTANNFTANGSNIGGFTSSMIGLVANTTYYVRAYATNSAGTAYGSQVSFTTNPIFLPTLTSAGLSAVSNSSANCGGNISNDGGSPITARGVCYSTSSNPTIANNTTIDGSGIGTYSSAILGLLPNTTYYVRAYATNSLGTAYGNQVIFTTQALAIGQNYLGGVIAYIDGSGLHGLIAAPSDQSNGIFWHASPSGITGATATALGTGNANTNAIVASYGTENNAAFLCNNLILNGYSDWYLPSKDEMTYLFTNSNAIGGFTTNFYWTSSEVNAGLAISFDFFNGNNGNYNKTNINYVRAVRTF